MNRKLELLKRVSKELELSFETQDWGIINSSSDRVNEFVQYFEDNQILENSIKYELFELIIASFNDAILEGKMDKNLKSLFRDFLDKNSHNTTFKPIIDYWKSIENEEYPVGKLLEEINN